jgi:hypothetical protein
MKLETVALVLGFVGSLLILVTTGNVKLGAVHSWETPRWAHYLAWGLLTFAFALQLYALVISRA